MSKRDELKQRRQQQQLRNRLIVIGLVVVGAALVIFALVIPGIKVSQAANAAMTAANAGPIAVTQQVFTARVDGRNLGDPNAPVKVVVYADFRCSACKNYSEVVEPGFIHDYVETGKVYYSYAIYPVVDIIDGSDASRRAANAALCAGGQNKFWVYHDTLYANQITESPDLFTDPRLAQMAQNVGLDTNAFTACYEAKKYDPEIVKSINEAAALNIHGTPTIVVNGAVLQDRSQLVQAVEAALAGE